MSLLAVLNVLALATAERTMWWIAIGIAAVVLIVVIALLQLLLRFVQDINTNVSDLWETAERVAANTATTWMLGATAQALEQLRNEAAEHERVLEAR